MRSFRSTVLPSYQWYLCFCSFLSLETEKGQSYTQTVRLQENEATVQEHPSSSACSDVLVAHNVPFNSVRMSQNHVVHCSVEGQWQRRWDRSLFIHVTVRQKSTGTPNFHLKEVPKAINQNCDFQALPAVQAFLYYQIKCHVADFPVFFLKVGEVSVLRYRYSTQHICTELV